jgi:hypothetical protein
MFYFLSRPALAYCRTSFSKSTRQPWAADAARWQQYFRDAPPQVGDEQVGGWSHAQLIRMDRFRARLLRAFKRGKESRQAATATYTPESGRQRA